VKDDRSDFTRGCIPRCMEGETGVRMVLGARQTDPPALNPGVREREGERERVRERECVCQCGGVCVTECGVGKPHHLGSAHVQLSDKAARQHPVRASSTLHSTPYTLHPTPYTLHPTPYTLHPTRTQIAGHVRSLLADVLNRSRGYIHIYTYIYTHIHIICTLRERER